MTADDTSDDGVEEEAVLLERPVDRVNPAFFRDIVDEYVAEDRLTGGVARLEIDGENERRFVVAEELPELSDDAYLAAELAELVDVLERDDELLDRPLELSIPVADAERVVEEAESEETVTVLFEPAGVRTLLEGLLTELETDSTDGD